MNHHKKSARFAPRLYPKGVSAQSPALPGQRPGYAGWPANLALNAEGVAALTLRHQIHRRHPVRRERTPKYPAAS